MQIVFPPSKLELATTYLGAVNLASIATGKHKPHIVNWVHSRMQPNYPSEDDMRRDLSDKFDAYMEKFRNKNS